MTTHTIQQTRPNLTKEDIKKMRQRTRQEADILSIDITEDAASVKLAWSFQAEGESRGIIDYILLLRIEGVWRIVAKVTSQQ